MMTSAVFGFVVRLEGVEPPTYSSVGCRSIQLSYRRKTLIKSRPTAVGILKMATAHGGAFAGHFRGSNLSNDSRRIKHRSYFLIKETRPRNRCNFEKAARSRRQSFRMKQKASSARLSPQ